MMLGRKPYHGSARKLVLAFDVGTTYSGVSYSILDPGEIPKSLGVRRFPGQEDSAGDSRIPSVLYYDRTGRVRAVGAEAQQQHMLELAEAERWEKIEWFKLHLRPGGPSESGSIPKDRISPLPRNKTVVDVFAHFISYLYTCTRTYITDTHASGTLLWASVERHIDFVFSHPNGWGGPQQDQMRRAAVKAGLVPDTQEGHAHVQFVTEGEASVHFCISNGLVADGTGNGKNIMVVDAGGGTIDISTYTINAGVRLKMEEIATPECLFHGSAIVSFRAREFLTAKLSGSRYSDPQDVEEMFKQFDKSAKQIFKNPGDSSYIRFGSMRDNDPSFGIRNGQLTLPGVEVASFFEPSVSAISNAINAQRSSASHHISLVFLVGGFAASPWLFAQLKSYVETLGMNLARPDTHTNKAVAEGALSFYLDHFVSARIARHTYGVKVVQFFDSSNVEHIRRSHRTFTRPSGRKVVDGAFMSVLNKGTQVSEEKEFTQNLHSEQRNPFTTYSLEIVCYKGTSSQPCWIDDEPHMYSTLCTVQADLSHVPRRPIQGPNGMYHQISFDVVLSFGLAELKAQLRWKVKGKVKRCPATIVYDELPCEADGPPPYE